MTDPSTYDILLALGLHFTNILAIASFVLPLVIAVIAYRLTRSRLSKLIQGSRFLEVNEQKDKIIVNLWRMILMFLAAYVAIGSITELPALIDATQLVILTVIYAYLGMAAYHIIPTIKAIPDFLCSIMPQGIAQWLIPCIQYFCLFLAFISALDLWGINITVIMGGMGIFAAAVALGSQDLFRNLLSSFSLIAEKRFTYNDWILVPGVIEGIVEDIGFRSTRVVGFDRAPVYVPNTLLADGAIINYTQLQQRRIRMHIGLEYKSTHDQLVKVRDEIKQYIIDSDEFIKPPISPLYVNISDFSASSIDILVQCYTPAIEWPDFVMAKETLLLQIKKIVEENEVSFAFPSQSIYLQNQSNNQGQDTP